ncbi:hypothetical protein AO498_16790 [Algoriphagus sanaruensis]|uniref:Uncharacterized protein n=1 Tax=Algoriphagus sanaruensis TaxID=1727163 RepID=A0A142ESK3_9BACT|nr:hypothetical protein AO498_16790 [Algoriphagus sanaruensis]
MILISDLNPSKSWAAAPHHVEGVPTQVYIFFILFSLVIGIYIFTLAKKEKKKGHVNNRLLEIESIIKSTKNHPIPEVVSSFYDLEYYPKILAANQSPTSEVL